MTDMFPDEYPIEVQIEEVKRELNYRRHVYPRLVAKGRLKQHQADGQTRAMEAVLKTLTDLKIEKYGDPGY